MTETYQIILIAEDEGGYSVFVPDIDGCFTQGDTIEDALSNAKDAIEMMLEDLRERGLPTPAPTAQVLNVQVKIPA